MLSKSSSSAGETLSGSAVPRVNMKRSSLEEGPEGHGGSKVRDWQSQTHVKWECKYHVVIVPKYRSKKIFGKIRSEVGGILRQLCLQKGIGLLEGHTLPDHVHMLLSVLPEYSIAFTIGYLKGKSAIRIHRDLRRSRGTMFGRSFWSRGYCVSTVGLDEEVIRQYIRNQEEDERDQDRGLLK